MSTDTTPPPYSPSLDRSKEIKDFSALTIELDNQIDTLNRYVLDIKPAYFQPSHKSEIDALHAEATRIKKLFVDYLWTDVRTGATDLEARVKDFVNFILDMIALPESEVPSSDKVIELKAFINRPPPKILSSDTRLNQILTLAQEILQLSFKYTSLLDTLLKEKNDEIDKFKDDKAVETATLKSLEEELEKIPPPRKTSWIPGKPSDEEKNTKERERLNDLITQSKATITQLEHDIAEGNRITALYAYKPTEFNKTADEVSKKIKIVAPHINTALLRVYNQLKNDALSFANDLEAGNPVNQDHVKDAQQQYRKVESALSYLATNIKQ